MDDRELQFSIYWLDRLMRKFIAFLWDVKFQELFLFNKKVHEVMKDVFSSNDLTVFLFHT